MTHPNPDMNQRLKVLEAYFEKMESSTPAELREMKRNILSKIDQVQDPEAREVLQRLFNPKGNTGNDTTT